MYKLLIVDDEQMVREGLQAIVEYLNLPLIGELLTARDGAEALEVIAAEEPALVLTDLNMPGMDGLELIRRLEENRRRKIIVISGYDDFHLVKESFKLGVQDYLLKPVHSGDLAEALNKMVNALQQEERQDLEGHAEKKLADLEKASRSLNQVLQAPSPDNDAIKTVLEELGEPLCRSHTAVAIASVLQTGSHGSTRSGNWETVLLEADAGSRSGIALYPFYNRNNDLVLWLNYESETIGASDIRNMLQPFLADGTGAPAVVAVGVLSLGNDRLAEAYQSALEVLRYKLVAGRQALIMHGDMEPKEDIRVRPEHLKALVEMIDMGRREGVLPLIQTYFGEETLRKSRIESIRHNYDMILQTIGWMANQKRDFHTFERSEGLRLYLKSCMLQMIEARESVIRGSDVVEISKKYVQDHLLKGINMAFIANYCNMSYNYFSKIFKESTGVSFQDYVTARRMEYAKRALTGINVKIHEVAEQLGYSNPKNFTRVFKNHFGVSPKEFQKQGH